MNKTTSDHPAADRAQGANGALGNDAPREAQSTPSLNKRRRVFDAIGSRLAMYCFVVAGVPTLLAFAARLHWTLELATHFRVQYSIGLFIAALVLFLLRRWKSGAIAAGLMAWNVALVVPVYWPAGNGGTNATDGRTSFKLIVANVKTSNTRYDEFLEFVRREDPDAVLLMEVDGDWLMALQPLREDFSQSVADPRTDNFGIALYSRLPWQDSRIFGLGDSPVPSVTATLKTKTSGVTLIGTHPLPPVNGDNARSRDRQLEALAALAEETEGPCIVAGDFNTTPWSPRFADLLSAAELRDSRQGFGIHATWPLGAGVFSIPIDHVLVSESIRVVDRRVGPSFGSDHRPIVVELAIQ